RWAGARLGAPRGSLPCQGAGAGVGADGVARASPAVHAWSAGRQGHQHDVEPDPEERGRTGLCSSGREGTRNEGGGRVEGRGAAPSDACDGGEAAVLRSGPQDLDDPLGGTGRPEGRLALVASLDLMGTDPPSPPVRTRYPTRRLFLNPRIEDA